MLPDRTLIGLDVHDLSQNEDTSCDYRPGRKEELTQPEMENIQSNGFRPPFRTKLKITKTEHMRRY